MRRNLFLVFILSGLFGAKSFGDDLSESTSAPNEIDTSVCEAALARLGPAPLAWSEIKGLRRQGANHVPGGWYDHDVNPVRHAIWAYANGVHVKFPHLKFLKWLVEQGANPDANLIHLRNSESLNEFVDRQLPSGPRRRRVKWLMKEYLPIGVGPAAEDPGP